MLLKDEIPTTMLRAPEAQFPNAETKDDVPESDDGTNDQSITKHNLSNDGPIPMTTKS